MIYQRKLLRLELVIFLFLLSFNSLYAQSKNAKNQTKKLKVTHYPSLPSAALGVLCNWAPEGSRATVKVTFDKTARITNAELVKPSNCPSFNSWAVNVSEEFKFKPAEAGGEPVTVTKEMHFIGTTAYILIVP